MKSITVSVPDQDLKDLIHYLNQFPSAEIIVGNDGFELNESQIEILDAESKVDLKFCVSRETLNQKLKNAI